MRLHKDFINELKGRVASRMLLFVNERSQESGLLVKISTLFAHIDSLDQELTELQNTNLIHVDDKRSLQRQLNSASEYGKKVNELGLKARNELIFAESRANSLEVENGLLLASLEQAMLDHQPVPLPKVIYDALVYYDKPDTHFNKWGILECIIKEPCDLAKNARMEMFRLDIDDLVFKALANGYTLEAPKNAAINKVAEMIEVWTNEPTFEDENLGYLGLATEIVGFMEGIKK